MWLTPGSHWRERYADWPALKKLEYMDELMRELAGQPPRRRVAPPGRSALSLKKTLRQHYTRKRAHYGYEHPNFYDRDLRRLFSEAPEGAQGDARRPRFLGRIRKDVCRRVARWTGEYHYTIDRVFDDMIARCRELNLRLDAAARGGDARVHGPAHRPDHELPAQRPSPGGAMRKLRVLALMHDYLVPPTDVTGIDLSAAKWKMEYDVTHTLEQ